MKSNQLVLPNRFTAMAQKFFFIGIDCGVETGVAVWDKKSKTLVEVCSMPIHKALELVKTYERNFQGDVLVRIEDARLRKWIPKGKTEQEERGRREGAGYVKRDAVIWEHFLLDHGIPYELVAPKNNKTKVKASYFSKLTGWKLPTNDHARDAAMLVFGF